MTRWAQRRRTDMHEDCRYWGLPRSQCMGHHVRISEYRTRQARAAMSQRGPVAARTSWIAFWLQLAIVATIIWWAKSCG